MDNMNIRKINGFTVQLVADGVYAIDEFGIALMYLIIGKTQALLLDTGVGAGNVHAVVKELTDLPCLVVNSHHHYDHAGGNVWFDEVYAHKNAVSVLKEQNCQEVRRAFIERQQADPILRMSEGLDHLQLTSPQIKYLSFLDGIHTILMKIRNRICYRRFSVIFFSIQLSLDKVAAYLLTVLLL